MNDLKHEMMVLLQEVLCYTRCDVRIRRELSCQSKERVNCKREYLSEHPHLPHLTPTTTWTLSLHQNSVTHEQVPGRTTPPR